MKATIALALAFLSLALILRVAFVLLFSPPAPQYDAAVYDVMARQIVNGVGVHAHGLRALRPPLYAAALSLVYALAGPSVLAAQAAQIALSLALLGFLFGLTRTVFGTPAAFVALALGSVHPQLVRYPSILMSENLYLPLLVGGTWAIAAARRPIGWLAAGVLFGLAALVREMALPVGVLAAVAYVVGGLWSTRRLEAAFVLRPAAFLAGMALAIGPWTIRNFLVLDGFVPITTNFGWVVWLGYNPQSSGYYHPFQLPPVRLTEVQLSGYFLNSAVAWVQEHPVRAAELTLYRLWLFWRPFFVASVDEGRLAVLFAAVKTTAFITILSGALFARRAWREPRLLAVWALCLVSTVGHALTHMEVGGRYRLPVEVSLIPLAGSGLFTLVRRIRPAAFGPQPNHNCAPIAPRPGEVMIVPGS